MLSASTHHPAHSLLATHQPHHRQPAPRPLPPTATRLSHTQAPSRSTARLECARPESLATRAAAGDRRPPPSALTLSAFARLPAPQTLPAARPHTGPRLQALLAREIAAHVGSHVEATAFDGFLLTGVSALSPGRQADRPDKARCSPKHAHFAAAHVAAIAVKWRPACDCDRSGL